MRRILIVMISTIWATMTAQIDPEKYGIEDSNLPKGLDIGDKAPSLYFSKTKAGDGKVISKSFHIKEELEKGPVIIMFYRGHWCPYCNRQLANLHDSIGYISELGAKLIAITPEKENYIEVTEEETENTIDIYSDSDGSVMRDFKVLFEVTEKYQNRVKKADFTKIKDKDGNTKAILPVPATYIIGTDGRVAYKYFNYNYRERVPISTLIEEIKKLK